MSKKWIPRESTAKQYYEEMFGKRWMSIIGSSNKKYRMYFIDKSGKDVYLNPIDGIRYDVETEESLSGISLLTTYFIYGNRMSRIVIGGE